MKEVFRIAGAKPKGLTCNAFLRAIHRDHPELRGETAYFPKQGMFGFTAIIGDLVLKALRLDNIPEVHRESGLPFRKAAFEREVKLLRHLKGKGLPVPAFIGQGQDPPYYIMSRNTGIRLEQENLDKMSVRERRQLAKDLAGFMAGLSKAVSAEEAKDMGFGKGGKRGDDVDPKQFKVFLDDPAIAKTLGNNFDFCRQMQTEFSDKYEEYLIEPRVFSHGDLHPGNILHDPAAKRIDGKSGGVIDLGLCHYLTPAKDCISLLFNYKPDFVAMVCDEYSKLTGRKLLVRDVIIPACAIRIGHLKQVLKNEYPEREERLPKLLKEIAGMKEYLADMQDAGPKKTSRRKPRGTPSR
jgi:hypothetical protein